MKLPQMVLRDLFVSAIILAGVCLLAGYLLGRL